MKRFVSDFLLALLVLSAATSSAAESNQTIRVGFGTTVINAPKGTPMAGYYHARGTDGVIDDLQAKVMVLDDGKTKAALVVLDLISTTKPLVDAARAAVEKQTGIPAAHVMISATHTHTAPDLRNGSTRSEAINASVPEAIDAVKNYSELVPPWIAYSVRAAISNLQPATLNIGVAGCDDLAFNRRFFMRDGSVAWNPGKNNPQAVMPAGVTDSEVVVLLAETVVPKGRFGKPLGSYINFALHPDTTGGTLQSADYPGALSRRMAEYHGSNFVTVFGNSTCGNINHTDVSWARPQTSPGEANRIGTILAASVFRSYKALQPVTADVLRIKSQVVKLPLREIKPEEVEQARIDIKTSNDKTRDGFMKLVRGFRNLDIYGRQGKPMEVEVQVVALGNEVAWVSLPGEVFVELGLAIKKNSPFRNTMLVELANGSIGYIPDRRSYAEGAYEPESARCAAGSGEMLVDAALSLLKELHAEASQPVKP